MGNLRLEQLANLIPNLERDKTAARAAVIAADAVRREAQRVASAAETAVARASQLCRSAEEEWQRLAGCEYDDASAALLLAALPAAAAHLPAGPSAPAADAAAVVPGSPRRRISIWGEEMD